MLPDQHAPTHDSSTVGQSSSRCVCCSHRVPLPRPTPLAFLPAGLLCLCTRQTRVSSHELCCTWLMHFPPQSSSSDLCTSVSATASTSPVIHDSGEQPVSSDRAALEWFDDHMVFDEPWLPCLTPGCLLRAAQPTHPVALHILRQ